MSRSWYYARNGQQLGPAAQEAVQQMLRTGEIQPGDLVWAEGMPQWVPASTVAEFKGFAVAPVYAPTGMAGAPLSYSTPMPLNYGGAPPKNYLVESILVTLCCCMPFGVVGIVFAAQVNGKFRSGDVAGAQASARTAKTWISWGFGIGLVNWTIYIAANLLHR